MNPPPDSPIDVLVLGGGAAGLFCALTAGQRGRRVVLLEHNDRVGKKIGISGGGRCNFTNLHARPENYLSENPDFCKSALARYTPQDFLRLVDSHRIPWHEKKLGQLFCDSSSKDIIRLLLDECASAGVRIITNCRIGEISKPDRFRVETTAGTWEAPALVVATGGLSLPKIGATDLGYRIARQFGHPLTNLQPALVPLTCDPTEATDFSSLSGVSIPALVACEGIRFRENILVTHRGLSGPAILQISSYWHPGGGLEIDLLPDLPGDQWLSARQDSRAELVTELAQHLPQRFARFWSDRHAPSRPLHRFKKPELADIAHQLHRWHFQPAGTEGYAKAEVTRGGVATGGLSSKTMESRSVPGLYFIGEVVDVTGWLGGFNFQWAWASGHAAGQAV